VEELKGIILAGGLGKRLGPLTKITNKHLLPVYDRPMIYYPLELLVGAGIKDILIVTGGHHAGEFLRLLGNGQAFGLKHINYTYQEGEGGIAQALGLARHFADNHKIIVVLGDNILENGIKDSVERFKKQKSGARLLLKKVHDPARFGVADIQAGKIVSIEEKPKKPKSSLAVTGVYMYDSSVFDIIKTLKPSRRGELEITDVNNAYLRRGELEFDLLKGWWTDSGTFDSLLRANQLVAGKAKGKA
jgi:glucose-1-phosphate thymidylyltransferase